MHLTPGSCPICSGDVLVTRIQCRECDTTIEGRFQAGPLSQLNPEQLAFIETFVRYEGKITHMEGELGLSYPTLRNRLHDIIRALGYEPGGGESGRLSDEDRRSILEELDARRITPQEAMRRLREDAG